jgi:hypothetical protein
MEKYAQPNGNLVTRQWLLTLIVRRQQNIGKLNMERDNEINAILSDVSYFNKHL